MKEIGVGVIGMGWMGEVHSSAYINYKLKFANKNISPKLIICSEILKERAKTAKDKFGFEEYTTSWQAVVDHPKVEVVDITTPNALHLEIIKYCIQKGKHINCEKPIGAFPKETLEAYELTKNYSKQTCVGFNYRWAPLVQYTKKLIDEGKIGKIYSYRGRFFSCYAADERSCYSWRFEKENGLGAITDIMTHAIDMALYLVGDIKRVNGTLKTFISQRPVAKGGASHYAKADKNAVLKEVTNDDYVAARISFQNGCEGFIDASRIFFGPTSEHSFEIYGSKGSIKWNFEEMNTLHLFLREEDESAMGYRKIYSSPIHPYHHYFNPSNGSSIGYDELKVIEIANFLEKIHNPNFANFANFEAAAKVAKVINAIIASSESKKEEKV